MKPTPRVLLLFSLLAIAAAVLGQASEASAQAAEVINVPATAFEGGIMAGVGRAPLQFTKPGLQICRFRMWAHDNDPAADVTARLIRKRITGDKLSPTGPAPEQIASVSSTGSMNTMRRFSTTQVSPRPVSKTYFYWVELVSGTIAVSGLKIETATSCG